MAIPTYDKLMRPVLELAAQQPINRRTATDAMVAQHALTPEEVAQRLTGGDPIIRNRTGWAMTFLTKAAGRAEGVRPVHGAFSVIGSNAEMARWSGRNM